MARSRGRRRRRRRRPPLLVAAVAAAAATGALPVAGHLLRPDPPAVAASGRGGEARPPAVVSPVIAPGAGDAAPAGRGAAVSPHTDEQALAYFHWRWGARDRATRRVTDIRTVGGYLRIYTDLPESAENDARAITLCERGAAYLTETRGTAGPVVFVHAETGENGNPVLANLLGPGDPDCRVTHPAPEG